MKTILIGTGIMVALLLAFVIVRQISDKNENRASESVEKAIAKYSAALQETNLETAYAQVNNDFNELFARYGSKNAAKIARIIYGDISYNAGDASTAIDMYKQALDDFSQEPALRNLVLSGLGYAFALKKEYPQSIRYFEMIASGNDKVMKSSALFNLGWIYETTGETEKSTALYRQLLSDFPDSTYGEWVKEKVRS